MPEAIKPLVYVSYAWRSRAAAGHDAELGPADDREVIVDELCQVLSREDHVEVGRDKKRVKTGDSIIDFAREIASGGLILAVISHKSLRSDWCMVHELLQAFRRRNFDPEEFGTDVLALVLEDALNDIRDPRDLVRHWLARLEQEQELMQLADPGRTGSPESWKTVDQLAELRGRLPDLIRALRVRAMPRGAEAIREQGFQAIRELVRERLEEKGLAGQISPSRLQPSGEELETKPRNPDHEILPEPEVDPDPKLYFLALTLQRAQEASGEGGEALYSWRIALKEPANSHYEPRTIASNTGPKLRRSTEPTPPSAAATGLTQSSVVDLLQEVVDWLRRQPFGSRCILELFVPVEWLDFHWSELQLLDRRKRNTPMLHLQELVPFVLRSWERLEDPFNEGGRTVLKAKFQRLATGKGRWLAGSDVCSQGELRRAENNVSVVGIKRLHPLETNLDARLDWLESMMLTMAPVALWPLPGRPERTLEDFQDHLKNYGHPLAGDKTGDPVAGDCRGLETLPLLRRDLTVPVVHDLAFLFDHPERAPAAIADQDPIVSF
jgi:hypothetical protein